MGRRHMLSRREAVAGLAASCAAGLVPMADAIAQDAAGPVFSPSGPKADFYGAAENYPIKDPSLGFVPGNPLQPKYRVGAFSHYAELFPTRLVKRAATPWQFRRAPAGLTDPFRARVSNYLSRQPVTGLVIAKDDQILFEHYQYGRTDRDLFLSQSMVKSITGLLIGMAIGDGAIKSVDDTAETYVPGLKGTEYGATPLRALLHMSSGVDFGEDRDQGRDLDRLWIDMVRGTGSKGTIASIAQFNRRIAPPGTRFYYASIEPDVLGLVLHYAVNKSASDYLREKIWEPIGAEADAKWLIDAEGVEVAHHGFNAVLRDYARLGRLLAHDGAWQGRQIIPTQWMLDATTTRPSDAYLAPARTSPTSLGYGYLIWLLPGTRRQFAPIGFLGQRILVDPASKVVMVQTAVENNDEIGRLWSDVVGTFG
jgi:CubicO group peptidase (beta-lactamase class C family)